MDCVSVTLYFGCLIEYLKRGGSSCNCLLLIIRFTSYKERYSQYIFSEMKV